MRSQDAAQLESNVEYEIQFPYNGGGDQALIDGSEGRRASSGAWQGYQGTDR
jgi:hypothetical protein